MVTKSEYNMLSDNFINYAELTMVKEMQNALNECTTKSETDEVIEQLQDL